jgi:uncharacterized protein
MRTHGPATKLVLALVIIGALNWGLVGFLDFNLVDAIFGGTVRLGSSAVSRVVYALVGIAGIAMFYLVLPRKTPFPGPEHRRGGAEARP